MLISILIMSMDGLVEKRDRVETVQEHWLKQHGRSEYIHATSILESFFARDDLDIPLYPGRRLMGMREGEALRIFSNSQINSISNWKIKEPGDEAFRTFTLFPKYGDYKWVYHPHRFLFYFQDDRGVVMFALFRIQPPKTGSIYDFQQALEMKGVFAEKPLRISNEEYEKGIELLNVSRAISDYLIFDAFRRMHEHYDPRFNFFPGNGIIKRKELGNDFLLPFFSETIMNGLGPKKMERDDIGSKILFNKPIKKLPWGT